MTQKKFFTDENGKEFRYVLCYKHYGWDEEKFGNDLEELDAYALKMKEDNSGKPLIIVNSNDEIVREYAPRLRNFS